MPPITIADAAASSMINQYGEQIEIARSCNPGRFLRTVSASVAEEAVLASSDRITRFWLLHKPSPDQMHALIANIIQRRTSSPNNLLATKMKCRRIRDRLTVATSAWE